MANKYNANIQRVRELMGHAGRQHEVLLSKSLFGLLGCVLRSIHGCPESTLLANSNMAVLDDVCAGKFVALSRILQNVLCNIYAEICRSTPGYAVRNAMSNLLAICAGNKITSATGRECCTSVIGHVLQKRGNDCASMLTEVVSVLTKQIKNHETCRLASFKALALIVQGCGQKIPDLHGELIKTAAKYASDKSADIRLAIAVLLTALAESSAATKLVSQQKPNSSADAGLAADLLGVLLKNIEDLEVMVQSTYAAGLARLLEVQMKAHAAAIEALKVDQNRGGTEETKKKVAHLTSGATSKLSSKLSTAFSAAVSSTSSSSNRKLLEEYSLSEILSFFSQQIASKTSWREGLLAAMTYFCTNVSCDLSDSDVKNILDASLHLMQEPSFLTLPHDDLIFFRSRVSLLIRSGITSTLGEARKCSFVGVLLSCIAEDGEPADFLMQRNEHQILVALNEVAHCVRMLQDASIGVCEEVKVAALGFLSHASFGVRTAAASVLNAIACHVEGLAAQILQQAITDARSHVTVLLSDGAENVAVDCNSKAARLSIMYRFHGQTLLISTLLRSADRNSLVTFPRSLVLETLSFGLDLLREDLLQAVPSNRSIVCSIIRAGSLVVSSCMNVGYEIVKEKVLDILVACDAILKGTLDASALSDKSEAQMQSGSRKAESKVKIDATSGDTLSTDKSSQEDNILYELMTVEAALVCLSSLLWLCPEALNHEDGQALVVGGLEIAFRAIKVKYQPRFRSHFRFRTLHAILLECFSWLPRGVFPDCCQQVFIEALRVFRDSISSGFECTNLNQHAHLHQSILDSSASNSILSVGHNVPCMLRLEKIYSCLQKKESEASLACIGNNGRRAARGLGFYIPASPLLTGALDPHFNFTSDLERGPAPVIEIDARTINAAIGLLSTTFVKQTPDYQSKTCILCAQAIEQFALKMAKESSYSSISTSLFGSDDERKKKEILAYNATKNVVCAFNAIIASFPTYHGATLDLDLNWGQLVVDTLFDLTTSEFCDIRNAACNGLASFASKLPSSGLIETLTERTSTSLSSALDRREKNKDGPSPSDLSGYLVLLTELFRLSPTLPDMRLHIVATIFNCIRKVDVSVTFRAHSFYALGVIFEDVASLVGGYAEPASDMDKAAFRAFLDKIWHSIDVHAVSIQTPGEEAADLLLVALLRLVSVTTPLTLNNIPSSAFVDHLLLTFDAMRCAASSPSLPLQEQALIMLQHFPSEKRLGAVLHVLVDVLVKHTYCSSTQSVGLLSSNLSVPVINFSNASLKQALLSVEALVKSHPQECVAVGLDIVLFHVLHWASSHPSLSSDLPSLEHRQREPPVDTVSIILQLINTLAKEDCKNCPDCRTGRWLLTLRSLCIGVSLIDDSGADGASSSTKATDENPTNYQQLLSHCKNEAAARIITICAKIRRTGVEGTALTSNANAQVIFGTSSNGTIASQSGLLVPSSAVKIAAITLAADLLSTCSIEGENVAQTDISLARKVTDEYLTSKEASQSSAPLFVSLLLPELVSMAVTCATFSINDKVLPMLHLESVRALEALVSRFGLSSDPDTSKATGDEHAPGGALSQFVPQFLSAIRPGLICQSVGLRFACCRVLCKMLEAGLLIDKVAVRRMVGGIVAAVVTRADKGLRAVLRADCNETASTIDFYVTHVILAKIYLLAQDRLKANSSISALLSSLLEPVLPSLWLVWHEMCIDAARFLQKRGPNATAAPSFTFPWPKETPLTSGIRGGLTYPPSAADSNNVKKCLLFAFPFVLAAVALTADCETHAELFCLACGLSDHISITDDKSRETKTLALRALDALSSRDVSSGEIRISSQQWASAVRHLSARAQGDEKEYLQVFVSLLCNLATRREDGQENLAKDNVDDQSLYEELLRASLISLHLILPTILGGFDAEAVMAGNCPTNSFVVGETKSFDVKHLRILSDLVEALFGLTTHFDTCNGDVTLVSRALGRLLSTAAVSGAGAASPLLQSIADKLIELGSRSEVSMPHLLVGEIRALREIASDLACYSATSSLLGVIARVLGDTSVLELFAPLLSELHTLPKLSALSRAFLQCAVHFANDEACANQELGNKLLSAALPSVLCLLQGDAGQAILNDDDSFLLLQVLFTVYKVAIVRGAFLSATLPTISSFLLSVESGGGIETSAKSYSFLCQALTQMAVAHPQELKEQVIYLSTEQRACLQKCLRRTAESGASQQSAAAPGPFGRIDVSRFKKV